jgi:DNA-directed RNA polymerase specialized sigma subunit
MTFIKFPCGDLEPVTILKYEGNQVCVKMEFTNTEEAQRLGKRVRRLSFELGWLEREIASELGISRNRVQYFKNRQKR